MTRRLARTDGLAVLRFELLVDLQPLAVPGSGAELHGGERHEVDAEELVPQDALVPELEEKALIKAICFTETLKS